MFGNGEHKGQRGRVFTSSCLHVFTVPKLLRMGCWLRWPAYVGIIAKRRFFWSIKQSDFARLVSFPSSSRWERISSSGPLGKEIVDCRWRWEMVWYGVHHVIINNSFNIRSSYTNTKNGRNQQTEPEYSYLMNNFTFRNDLKIWCSMEGNSWVSVCRTRRKFPHKTCLCVFCVSLMCVDVCLAARRLSCVFESFCVFPVECLCRRENHRRGFHVANHFCTRLRVGKLRRFDFGQSHCAIWSSWPMSFRLMTLGASMDCSLMLAQLFTRFISPVSTVIFFIFRAPRIQATWDLTSSKEIFDRI